MNKYFAYLTTANSHALMNIIEDGDILYTLTMKDANKLTDLTLNKHLTMELYQDTRKENLSCEIITNQVQVLAIYELFSELDFNYFTYLNQDSTNLVLLKMKIC